MQTGATFADAAAEFLRYVEQDRTCKPSTLRDYRSSITHHLLPAFGGMRLEDITAQHVERWRTTITSDRVGALSNRSKNKLLVVLHGVLKRAMKVWGLPVTRRPASSAIRSARAVTSMCSIRRRCGR